MNKFAAGIASLALAAGLTACSAPPTPAPAAPPAPASTASHTSPQTETYHEEIEQEFPCGEEPEYLADETGKAVALCSGVKVQITKVEKSTVCGYDSYGTPDGTEAVLLTFKITNEGKRVWRGIDTYVSVAYGQDLVEAAAVSDECGDSDEVGRDLPPGRSVTKTNKYAVPADEVDGMLVSVTMDANGNTVTFS